MGGAAVQRISLLVQLPQLAQRIGDLEERALAVVAQAAEKLFGRGAQVDNGGMRPQRLAVGFAKYRTSARRKHHTDVSLEQATKGHLLDVTKYGFTATLEELRDCLAYRPLNFGININEANPKRPSKMTPDSGLTTSGHSYQSKDKHRYISSPSSNLGFPRKD